MVKLVNQGVIIDSDYNINIENIESEDIEKLKRNTLAYSILKSHNKDNTNDNKLKIKFDKLTSHDITYVGIIQTARASGLTKFPVPYILTNCHNSLCAVGGTINEDDHVFGLSAAKKYGGVFVPAHVAVIHQYAREMLASCGSMILGSDSHTRYGALGCMGIGEGGPEIVKQLLSKTYDIDFPEVVGIYLKGFVKNGVGPQDIALAIIKAVFNEGFVNNKIMEFIGPGIENLSIDYRIGIDVMTTETTCLSSIWETDNKTKEFYLVHNNNEGYKELKIKNKTYYDKLVIVDLDKIVPMIAMPFHPSNVYTIKEVIENPYDILREVEEKGKEVVGDNIDFKLTDKIKDGRLFIDQGIIAGCAGGGYENILEARDILKEKNIGDGSFNLSIYPASIPIYSHLSKIGALTDLIKSGAVIKTAFCGPCFGAGDTPSNNSLSIRHTTRNFPNREGSKPIDNQIASVALVDARSIAATAANKGFLIGADSIEYEKSNKPYYFDKEIYEKRVYDGRLVAMEKEELIMGPNIKDWPYMYALTNNALLKVASFITDSVTTTDELIPSGETSSYRSNPLRLAEYALSRKDPKYVERAKEIREQWNILKKSNSFDDLSDEIKDIIRKVQSKFDVNESNLSIASTIYAKRPGDGSAREQAASCQRVLGGLANIANGYATKRYRSNLINWGMIPFEIEEEKVVFELEDYIFIPDIVNYIDNCNSEIKAYIVNKNMKEIQLKISNLTDTEKKIIKDGCLINYYKNNN